MKPSSRFPAAIFKTAATLLILAVLATACSSDDNGGAGNTDGSNGSASNGDGNSAQVDGSSGSEAAQGVTVSIDGPGGTQSDTEIVITLEDSDGDAERTVQRETTVEGDPLGAGETDDLLNRLPDLEAQENDQLDFSRPPETRPRPRPGNTVEQAFPPDAAGEAPATESGPLEVLRFQPQGPVDLAPFISVTFGQPMVELSTLDQIEAADVPITITPEMPGRWIWLGAKTVRFEYEPGAIDRIPAATNYTVEIPAGTQSATGGSLGQAVSFEFSTPTPQVEDVRPINDSLATEQIFFIEFDQRVDADAVLGSLDLLVEGDDVAIRLASGDEINEDTDILRLTERALPDRWVAIRPVEPMPTDAALTLRIGPSVPSAEGPETSEAITERFGRTYGKFEVFDTRCGWERNCPPGSPFMIEMSNPVDAENFTADMVSVEPPIPGMRVGVSWNTITISGRTSGQTDYDVTLRSAITDTFGQALGEDVTERFSVGDAEPALFRPGRSLVTLDPIVDNQQLNITSINHRELKLTIYDVDPNDDWQTFQENQWDIARGAFNQWPVANTRTVNTGMVENDFTETAIDLSNEFEDTDHRVIVVEPTQRRNDDWRSEPFAIWVQNTSLGIDAVTDNQRAIAWVTDLRSGEPVNGATVNLIGGGTAETNGEGIAEIALANRSRGMLVTDGDRSALIGEFWAERWNDETEARWYVMDDRGIYKPGETARLKGWVRGVDPDAPAQLTLPRPAATVSWFARDGFGNQIGAGEAELSDLGGFDIEIDLPEDMTLGYAGIEFTTNGIAGANFAGTWHELQVQEFRRPDFEVSADIVQAGPYLAGKTFTIDAQADFFAGGALATSPVDWQVTGRETSYSPPTWPDFNFGIWVPWWFGFDDFAFEPEFFDGGFGGFGGGGASEFFSATTDGDGTHSLDVTIDTEGKPRPVQVTASATVVDVNRQPVTGSTGALVHPADLYVGLRGARTFVRQGDALNIDVIVTDIDGEAVPGTSITVESRRLNQEFVNGSWTEVEIADESCETTSEAEPVVCTFRPSEGGRYRIAATVTDADGRENLTELTRWVAGGTQPASRRVNLEQLTLVPSDQTFQPGDTAEVLVQAPFAEAHGIVVISRRGIDRTQPIEFDSAGSAVVQIPITSDDIPGIGLQFEVAGVAPRTDDADGLTRPAFAAGQLSLEVPPNERELTIDVAPRMNSLQPGGETQVDVAVTDSSGDPVPDAELTVVVVDEAVLSLTNYQLRDPLSVFYERNFGFTQVFRGRTSLLLSDPDLGEAGGDATTTAESGSFDDDEAMEEEESADFAMDSADEGAIARSAAPAPEAAMVAQDGGEAPAINLRTNFDALAVFAPEVRTDADGRATVDVPLPDNLTRYRVMVVATADATNAGTGDSNITARLPVTVRPTPPRFANFGDRFEFPVVVQNGTDEDLDIDVAIRSTNLTVDQAAGITARVPANDRVEVRFDVSAEEAGIARYQVVAAAGDFADAAEGEFPVYTPATAEAFATYGVVDDGSIAQPFSEPANVFPQFGGLEITTSSTAVAALTDAVIYLGEYRYENSDAFASRIIALVALEDIIDAFEAEQLPDNDELRSIVNRDLDRLSSMQNDDGGFPYWQRGRESIPYNTVQASHALVLADRAGFPVDAQVLANAKFALASIEDFYPNWYDQKTRRSVSAYALYVRNLAGDRDINKATGLYNDAEGDIELDIAAWLWPILADTDADAEIELLFNNRVTETPNGATFATSYGEQQWVLLHSDRRTDAVILEALVQQRPDSDLVLKTLNGILAARDSRGRWSNMQENSFVLLAGAAYFEQFEDADPDFIARAWLGDTYALEHDYRTGTDGNRSTDRNLTVVPMAELVDAGDTDIVVERDGTEGRLYYRLGLRYAPTDFDLEPRDQGFVVQRTYEPVDDDGDVVQNDDGSWTVKAGARVRVRLTMVADSRRTHVALIDPIPAGLEIINPSLATSEPIPQADPSEGAQSGYWWYQWFDHQNLRDDRAEAFSTWLGAGTYEYTYVARATTPGTFVTPPTRAEMMYEPEVFGRGASTTVTVTD